jgi:hypothetical protein
MMGVTWVGHPDSWNKETRRQMQDWLWLNGMDPNDIMSYGFRVRPGFFGGWIIKGHTFVRDESGGHIIDKDCLGRYEFRTQRFKIKVDNDPPTIAFTPTIKEW